MKILFLGDVFGEVSIDALEKHLKKIIVREKIDFTIAQGENVSGRKGLVPKDYDRLKKAGVDAFTMGNHIWAKRDIKHIINNKDIIRPYNVDKQYPGKGSRIFTVKGQKIRVSQFMGISFNELNSPWEQKYAYNFFDEFDKLNKTKNHDIHIIDFHAETTSEKNVFGLYVDGKVDAFVGTHTHIQTNDARILPKGTAFITDVGMVGPINSAIGASYESVYKKMRFDEPSRFEVSQNSIELNAVVISINKKDREIKTLRRALR